MIERPDRRGFSLIEALVALAVLGIVLGTALAAGGGSLDVADRARREAAMAVFALSLLERAGLDLLRDTPLAEGTHGGFRWRLERRPAEEEGTAPGDRAGERRVRLWRIEARVEDGRGGRFVLATLDLAEAP